MNILVAKNSGFCAGVKNTILKAEEELKKNKCEIDCLGEIIHNKQVIQNLESKGLRIIDSIEDAGSKVIIRAHGTTKEVYEYAKENNIELIDLTCPNVLQIHKNVESYSSHNFFVFLFGIKNHPETIGTYSFCNNNSYLLEASLDIPSAISSFKASRIKRYSYHFSDYF